MHWHELVSDPEFCTVQINRYRTFTRHKLDAIRARESEAAEQQNSSNNMTPESLEEEEEPLDEEDKAVERTYCFSGNWKEKFLENPPCWRHWAVFKELNHFKEIMSVTEQEIFRLNTPIDQELMSQESANEALETFIERWGESFKKTYHFSSI